MRIIGRIEPFEDTVETWTSYTERLEQYFEVNDIAEDKKVPALLTLLGGFHNSMASFVAVSIATAISNALSSESSLIVNSFF
jgi:hypothetical protein